MGCREKSIPLLHYISELVKLRTSCVLDLRDQAWHVWLDQLPLEEPEWFQMADLSNGQEELTEDGARICSPFRNPQYDPCPDPPGSAGTLAHGGWDDRRRDAVLQQRNDDRRWISLQAGRGG